MSNPKTSIDDKTKAALKGYVVASVNASTKLIEEGAAKIRGAIESDNLRAAVDQIDEARVQLNALSRTVQHSLQVQDIQLYSDKELMEDSDESPRKMRVY